MLKSHMIEKIVLRFSIRVFCWKNIPKYINLLSSRIRVWKLSIPSLISFDKYIIRYDCIFCFTCDYWKKKFLNFCETILKKNLKLLMNKFFLNLYQMSLKIIKKNFISYYLKYSNLVIHIEENFFIFEKSKKKRGQ